MRLFGLRIADFSQKYAILIRNFIRSFKNYKSNMITGSTIFIIRTYVMKGKANESIVEGKILYENLNWIGLLIYQNLKSKFEIHIIDFIFGDLIQECLWIPQIDFVVLMRNWKAPLYVKQKDVIIRKHWINLVLLIHIPIIFKSVFHNHSNNGNNNFWAKSETKKATKDNPLKRSFTKASFLEEST